MNSLTGSMLMLHVDTWHTQVHSHCLFKWLMAAFTWGFYAKHFKIRSIHTFKWPVYCLCHLNITLIQSGNTWVHINVISCRSWHTHCGFARGEHTHTHTHILCSFISKTETHTHTDTQTHTHMAAHACTQKLFVKLLALTEGWQCSI